MADIISSSDLTRLQIGDLIDSSPNSDSLPRRSEADPAYLIYTSGSTGKPKGVLCADMGVTNLLDDLQSRQLIGPGDVGTFWTSLGFDVSVYEIFSPLLAGATLAITPEPARLPGAAFIQWLVQSNATSAYIPPFCLPELVEYLESGRGPEKLRRILIGVEPIPERVAGRIQAALPEAVIVNGYGPTEATVCTTLHTFVGEGRDRPIPIGAPVQNTKAVVVDEWLQPTPIGVQGRLFVGGVGLAFGYLGNVSETASRFTPDPTGSGARLYDTGDIVRFDDDGSMTFVGRADRQVKLRGFRIELGEVEAALRSHPSTKDACVVIGQGERGTNELIAYVVSGDSDLSVASLRTHLNGLLPRFMVPSIYIALSELPLGPNGKLDRESLPDASSAPRLWLGVAQEQPKSDLERSLAGIWSDVLGVGDVGRLDNFFDLGGTSLDVKRVQDAVEQRLSVHLETIALFEHPTISALAAAISANTTGSPAANSALQARVARRAAAMGRGV
jgi:amino acid adenylation domain-containing protein